MASKTDCATSAAVTLPLATALSLMAWAMSWLRVALVWGSSSSAGRLRWLWWMPVGTKNGHSTWAWTWSVTEREVLVERLAERHHGVLGDVVDAHVGRD
jgi:hypothetical protein